MSMMSKVKEMQEKARAEIEELTKKGIRTSDELFRKATYPTEFLTKEEKEQYLDEVEEMCGLKFLR